MSQQEAKPSRMVLWVARLSRWPRGLRMALCAVIALLTVALVVQIVTLIAGGPAEQFEASTASTILLLAAGAGLVVYMVGWWSLIGFSGDPHPVLGTRAANFLLFGLLVTLALLVWALISTIIAFLPPEIPI